MPTERGVDECAAWLHELLCCENPPKAHGHPGCTCQGADCCTFHAGIDDLVAAAKREREEATAKATQACLEWLLEDNISEFEDARWALEQMMKHAREEAYQRGREDATGRGPDEDLNRLLRNGV